MDGREKEGPKLLLNQGPSEPCYATDSVLSGTSQSNLNELQHVQNAVARMVMATSKRQHITSVLAELHWLPVAARIDFIIAT